MKLTALTMFLIVSTCWAKGWHLNDKPQHGIFIYSVLSKNSITGGIVKVIPDDSIFFCNGFGIEKVMRSDDMIIDDKFVSTDNKIETFYIIDFREKRYAQTSTPDSLQKPLDLNKRFSSPKSGFDFTYQYYNGEEYVSRDTLIGGEKYMVVQYISTVNGPNKGALMKLLLSPMKGNFDQLIPNIEGHFKARFKMLEVIYPKNMGTIWMKLDFIPEYNNYWSSIFNRLDR